MKKTVIFVISCLFMVFNAGSQTNLYRSGIFLHHSTGGCIWGPNGSSTSVPQQMTLYNAAHGYTGANQVTLSETWYPAWNDNEWVTWHSIFETNSPENISGIISANKIVMVKSCFPCSEIASAGSDQDTLDPWYKSVANYKWHWRHIVNVMKNHPDNFFVIWTNAPLEWYSTDSTQSAYSDWFCYWAKDTLATGLDPVYGVFPPNVYVFDFFHKLTDPYGFLPQWYASGPGDSHPNAAATALVAPQLVNEIFDAAIAYESGKTLNIKVLLEGPFNGAGMNAVLTGLPAFPLAQPYNAYPWNYTGTESVSAIPGTGVVDWILLEFRDAVDAVSALPSTRVGRQAAFLLNDGSVTGTDGASPVIFNHVILYNLYVIIRHRNHISVMSSDGLPSNNSVYSWDFTTGAGQAFGGNNAHKELAPGIWGMTGADGNADNQVNNGDKNDIWAPQAGSGGYVSGDFNMDGQVNNGDKNDVWALNTGLGGQVPDVSAGASAKAGRPDSVYKCQVPE